MNDEAAELLVQQLYSDDWIARGIAARRLIQSPDTVLRELPRFFELTFDDKAPVRSSSWLAINDSKSLAVPFLLDRAGSKNPSHRSRAIELLGTVGRWNGGTSRFAAGELEARKALQPDLGEFAEQVLGLLLKSLSDQDRDVRFAAASLLEDLNRSDPRIVHVFVDTLANGTLHQKRWAALRFGRIGPEARSASRALSYIATTAPGSNDIWEHYTKLAAEVALKKVGREASPQVE